MQSTQVRVAAIQAKPVSTTFEAMFEGTDVPHAVELLADAAAKGANLVCFPELYPRVGEETLREAARQYGVLVVAGLAEPAWDDRWYNTATFISSDGDVIGRQRKVYPTALEVEAGVIPGDTYEVFETPVGRLGAVICADFAFFDHGVKQLKSQGVDILFNPAYWFALGEAYAATVIGRHMEYGFPVIGVDIAACALSRVHDGKLVQIFPKAGGFSTVTAPPPVATLDELGDWFRQKHGGANSMVGFAKSLGEEEGILLVDIDVDAVRAFPGYFYTESAAGTDAKPVNEPAAAATS